MNVEILFLSIKSLIWRCSLEQSQEDHTGSNNTRNQTKVPVEKFHDFSVFNKSKVVFAFPNIEWAKIILSFRYFYTTQDIL